MPEYKINDDDFLGENFHFEIVNKDQLFIPPNEIKPPSGAGSGKSEDLKKHVIILKVPR